MKVDIKKVLSKYIESGFYEVDARRILKNISNELIAGIELIPMKGSGYILRWGFLITFVPKLKFKKNSKSTVSKTTNKKSSFDIFYDPVDYASDPCLVIAYSEDEMVDLVEKLQKNIDNYFAKVKDIKDTIVLYKEMIKVPYKRFGFWNYPQVALAYPYVLNYLNQNKEAEENLELWIDRFKPEEKLRIELLKLLK
jgi:hypothetical protein